MTKLKEIRKQRGLAQIAGQESPDPIGDALKGARRTIKDVCAKIGMSRTPVKNWRAGTVAWRDSLERFAEEVNAPWLLMAVPSKPRRIIMTCTICEHPTPVKPGILRGMLKNGIHQDAVIDWKTGLGTYTCNSCSARKNITAFNGRKSQETLKRKGRRLWREYGQGSILNAIENSQRARVGRPRPPEVRLKISATTITTITGRLYLCRVCGLWGLSRRSDGPRGTHPGCLAQWRSEHPELAFGAYPPPVDVEYPHGGTLEAIWELTWRHVVKGEKLRGSELVAEFILNRTWAVNWVHFVLDRLPADDRGGKRLTRRAEILRWKAEGLGYHPTMQEAQLPEIDGRLLGKRKVWAALPDGPPGLSRRELANSTGMGNTSILTAIRRLGEHVARTGKHGSRTNPPRYSK